MILRFTRQPDGFSHCLTIETDSGEQVISEIISAGKMAEIAGYLLIQATNQRPPSLTIETSKTVPAFERMIDARFIQA